MGEAADEQTWGRWWASAQTNDRALLLLLAGTARPDALAGRGWDALPAVARQRLMAAGDPDDQIAMLAPLDEAELHAPPTVKWRHLPPPPALSPEQRRRSQWMLHLVSMPLMVVAFGIDLAALRMDDLGWRLLLTLLSIGVGMAAISMAIRHADRAGLLPRWATHIPDRSLGWAFAFSLFVVIVLTVLGA